jgi:hypothetical protein
MVSNEKGVKRCPFFMPCHQLLKIKMDREGHKKAISYETAFSFMESFGIRS